VTKGRTPAAVDPARAATLDRAWLAIGLVSLVALVALTIAVGSRVVFPFDQPVLIFARGLDGWPFIWQAMSQSANIPLIVIGVGFVVRLVWIRRYREAFLVAATLVAVTAGSEGIKQLVARPRPSGTGDGIPGVVFSYPSGHVLEVLSILGMVTIRSWRSALPVRLRQALIVLVTIEVVLVAIARLALNEHYPSDLLGGLFGALGALGLYAWFTRPSGWANRSPITAHGAAGPRAGSRQPAPSSAPIAP
jgi:membrane-associated phospholipid phosphatase